MPARHALSGRRGLPPLGFALGTGINGSTSFHSPSGNSWIAKEDPRLEPMLPCLPFSEETRFC